MGRPGHDRRTRSVHRRRNRPGEAEIESGDLLAIYRDGVAEAAAATSGLFGDRRPLAAMMTARGGSARQALGAVLNAVEAFSRPGDPAEDTPLIVVRRVG